MLSVFYLYFGLVTGTLKELATDPLGIQLNLLVQFLISKKGAFDAGLIVIFLWIDLSHAHPPGFAVDLLSGQRVLDYTTAQSSPRLCCSLSYSSYSASTAVSPLG